MSKWEQLGRWNGLFGLVLAFGVFVQISGLLFNNDGSRYGTQSYLLLFVPALVYLITLRFDFQLWRQSASIAFVALLGCVLAVALANDGSSKDPLYWLKITLLIFLYVFSVAKLVSSSNKFTFLVKAVVGVAVIFSCWTLIYQFCVLDRSLDYEAVRWRRLQQLGWNDLADLGHPITAGLYYGCFAVCLTWLFISRPVKLWQVVFFAVGIVGLVLYVLLTFSRGAWFSLAAGGIVLLLLFPNYKSRSLIGLGIVLLLLAAYLFWPELQNEQAVGVNGRELIWANWFAHFSEFWLTGMGAGSHLYYEMSPGRAYYHAHSLYLQLWYEYGIVGISLFVALLLSLLWKGWQCREQAIARLGLALLVFAMVAMVSDVYAIFHRPSPYWVIVWFPVGILLGVQPKREQAIN